MGVVKVFYLAVSVAGLAACLRPVSPALLVALFILREDLWAAALVEEVEVGVLEREAPLIEGVLVVADIDSSRRGSLSRMGWVGGGGRTSAVSRSGAGPHFLTAPFGERCCGMKGRGRVERSVVKKSRMRRRLLIIAGRN